MVKKEYFVGDLVFAKVKGYPPWPARITGIEKGKYAVFFYGTYEHASVKNNELFEFSAANQENFIPKNSHRKNYMKGIEELRNTPEIAPGPDEDLGVDDLTAAVHTPTQLMKQNKPQVRKPMKLSDGTPLKREAGATPPRLLGTPETQKKKLIDDSESEDSPSVQQTSSRSGRVIKQKRFSDDIRESEQNKPRADLQIEDPRKIWVKKRTTGDMIEIQLDKERPERWESHEQKLTWMTSTARNAIRLKEFVELGEYIPSELVESLKDKSQLTPEEKDQLKQAADQAARKEKVTWLLREHELVDSIVQVMKSLPPKDPDTDECVRLLQSVLRMDIDLLMILKHPFLLDTVRKLRQYQGPSEEVDLAEKDKERFNRNIRSIQSMAETLFKKFQVLCKFKESGETDFTEFFQSQIHRFEEKTKHMKQAQRLKLTQYPE